MNMVGHQAVAQDSQPVAPALSGQQGQVESAITVVEEGFLAVISPLRNVVRRTHRNHASMAWHRRKFRTASTKVSKLSLSRFLRFFGSPPVAQIRDRCLSPKCHVTEVPGTISRLVPSSKRNKEANVGRLLILFIVAVTLQAAETVNSQYVLDACTKATKDKVKRGDAMEVGWCLGTVEAVRRTVELLDLRDKVTGGAEKKRDSLNIGPAPRALRLQGLRRAPWFS
jgi:hypothetical protein